MTATKVRADYEQLTAIAQAFGQQAESAQQMLNALQSNLSTLQGGDWVGKGADAFYAEMNTAVLPAMKRVVAAMNEAASTTTKISRIMKQAEDDAAALFRLNGEAARSGAGGSGTLGGRSDGTVSAFVGGKAGPDGGGSGGSSGVGSGNKPSRDRAPAKGKQKGQPANTKSPASDANDRIVYEQRHQEDLKQIKIREAKREAYYQARLAQSQSWDWLEVKKHIDQRISDRQRLVHLLAEIEAENWQIRRSGRDPWDTWSRKMYEWYELADKYRVDAQVDRLRALQLVSEAAKKGASNKILNEMMGDAQTFQEINVGNDILIWQAKQEDIYPKELGGKGKQK